MSGIMTDTNLTVYIDGEIRKIPFLNTREYFDESVCFAIKKGDRFLYLPAKTDSRFVGFSRSICFYHNNNKYFFITRDENLKKNLHVSMILRQTYSSRAGAGGYLVVGVGGQILGLTFTLHFTHKSGNYCCEDFDLTVTAGSASISKEVVLASSMLIYSEVKTVTCDISNTTFDIDIYGSENGEILRDELNFDLSE